MEKKGWAFKKASTYDDLKESLSRWAAGLKNNEIGKSVPNYLCHYTSLESAIKIIKNGVWYIGSPKNMNDELEFSHGEGWDKIFFASFMHNPKESIAMWSMYAQPWEEGVMLCIPTDSFKKWIKETDSFFISSANPDKTSNGDDISSIAKVSAHAVAYTNAWSKDANEDEYMICGGQHNYKINSIRGSKELTGYIKDIAWSYENEIRLRIDIQSQTNYEALLLRVPDYVINQMKIVAGPRFVGNLQDKIQSKIEMDAKKIEIGHSIFAKKLKWVYCDDCLKRKL